MSDPSSGCSAVLWATFAVPQEGLWPTSALFGAVHVSASIHLPPFSPQQG